MHRPFEVGIAFDLSLLQLTHLFLLQSCTVLSSDLLRASVHIFAPNKSTDLSLCRILLGQGTRLDFEFSSAFAFSHAVDCDRFASRLQPVNLLSILTAALASP